MINGFTYSNIRIVSNNKYKNNRFNSKMYQMQLIQILKCIKRNQLNLKIYRKQYQNVSKATNLKYQNLLKATNSNIKIY